MRTWNRWEKNSRERERGALLLALFFGPPSSSCSKTEKMRGFIDLSSVCLILIWFQKKNCGWSASVRTRSSTCRLTCKTRSSVLDNLYFAFLQCWWEMIGGALPAERYWESARTSLCSIDICLYLVCSLDNIYLWCSFIGGLLVHNPLKLFISQAPKTFSKHIKTQKCIFGSQISIQLSWEEIIWYYDIM